MASVALLVEGLDVRFGTFQAIDHLAIAIDYGEVRAVIGPNGAGKTTLLDVISGITSPSAGRVLFDETIELTRRSESEIARVGVRRKFQKPSVFDALTVPNAGGANAAPAVYEINGVEYVVNAFGGSPFWTPLLGDAVIAFALPSAVKAAAEKSATHRARTK